MTKTFLLAAVAIALMATAAQAATYDIDLSHSSVSFKVKHMMVSNVRGSFNDFAGSFTYDPEAPAQGSVNAEIKMASVDTADEKRDEHLRSPDFFDVENHPEMTFASSKVEARGDDEYVLHGDLTLNGVTKSVALDLEYVGMVNDPWGNTRVGFEARGEIDRKDFGITWSKNLDGGGLVVGDKVKIELEIEGIQQK